MHHGQAHDEQCDDNEQGHSGESSGAFLRKRGSDDSACADAEGYPDAFVPVDVAAESE